MILICVHKHKKQEWYHLMEYKLQETPLSVTPCDYIFNNKNNFSLELIDLCLSPNLTIIYKTIYLKFFQHKYKKYYKTKLKNKGLMILTYNNIYTNFPKEIKSKIMHHLLDTS